MPLFEYRCQSCKKDFDLLELPGRDVNKNCPSCGSTDVVQKVSVFSAHSGASSSSFPETSGMGCGNCSGDPSSCPMKGNA